MIILSTVWYSGTHSLFQQLGLNPDMRHKEWEQFHCRDRLQQYMDLGMDIRTTLRDPYRVAASWYNRGRISKDNSVANKWCYQWEWLGKILPTATVYPVEDLDVKISSVPDISGLHEALDNGDFDFYHDHIPENWIKFAHSVSK